CYQCVLSAIAETTYIYTLSLHDALPIFDVRILPARISNGSLCSEPRMRVDEKPEPISNPLVAGKLSIAFARSASSLSKTGSPRRSEEHTSELQSRENHVSRLLLDKKKIL